MFFGGLTTKTNVARLFWEYILYSFLLNYSLSYLLYYSLSYFWVYSVQFYNAMHIFNLTGKYIIYIKIYCIVKLFEICLFTINKLCFISYSTDILLNNFLFCYYSTSDISAHISMFVHIRDKLYCWQTYQCNKCTKTSWT